MKYIGNCKDVENNDLRIEFITQDSDLNKDYFILAPDPIETTLNGGDDIYKPIKYGSATIRMYLDFPTLDMYAPAADSTPIKLFKNDVLEWVGYVEPSMYSQQFETDIDLLELNCIDGLTILQYFPYTSITGVSKIQNIVDILKHIISQCHCYNNIYIAKSYLTDIKLFELSEQNFFDEDNNAMMFSEVLEEICKYLGLTCLAYRDSVYFIDYDYLKLKDKFYTKINLIDDSIEEVLLSDDNIIDKSSFSGSGNKLSLDNVYNKITVRDDFYTIDSVIPDIFDPKHVKNWNGSGYIDRQLETVKSGDKEKYYMIYSQYLKSDVVDSYYYNPKHSPWPDACKNESWKNWQGDILTPLDPSSIQMSYQFLKDSVGGTLLKRYQMEVSQPDPNKPFWGIELPPKIDFENIILLTPSDYLSRERKPLLTIPLDLKQVFAKNYSLLLSGDVMFNRFKDHLWVTQGDIDTIYYPDFYTSQLYITATLRIGNKYFSGTNLEGEYKGEWIDTPTTFNIYLSNTVVQPDEHSILLHYHPITNNANYLHGLERQGFLIPLPSGKYNGDGEFSIVSVDRRLGVVNAYVKGEYRSESDPETDHYMGYKHWGANEETIFIKNFDISLVTPGNNMYDDKTNEEDDSNTEYSNVINEEYVKEKGDIVFKVCTWDNKKPNYSCVILNDKYLDTTTHSVFTTPLRQEEHLIERYVNQYKDPAIIFDLNLFNKYHPYDSFNYLMETCIMDSQTINWEKNTTSIRLIQKK